MILESLNMQRQLWGPNEGKMEGKISFKNPDGEIQIILNNETCHKMLALCAEGLVKSAQEVALNLTASVLLQTGPLLENKP
ncbi:MAG: hypothetical protein ACYC9L_16150 [Sulfuricaulis sp.]